MKPKLTFEQAHDLLDNFQEACKNDPEPIFEEVSTLKIALIYLLSGRDTIKSTINYIEERTKKNNMKGAGK